MSNIEQIDFSTLIWVKKELDETLKRAQAAIEEYVENPEDENQLQFCATYLHQVQGTLKMVELYGAAMVAEEMEQVAKKILDKEVDSEKDAFEVLMRGIILLPDYLERIQLGYKDIPMVLLPLVNDLRTVKGDHLLSESALFNPDLSLGLPESALNNSFKLSESQLTQVVKKIRSAYQVCLLNWLKEKDVLTNLKKIQIIVDKLKTVLIAQDEKQLFWVAGGLFEALISGGLEKSVTVKQLSARLDQSMRLLTDSTNVSTEKPFKKLTNSFLYYVALADKKDRRIKEIQDFFKLKDFISDDVEIEQAQSSLSGKNRELLESVTSVIKEDLMGIQENLDLYNRNENAKGSDLQSIIDSLRKISDTLGIIGVGVARSKIITVVEKLDESAKIDKRISKDTIMNVAEVLLFVESSLDQNIMSLGDQKAAKADIENLIPNSEMKKIMDSLAIESINNLQKVKQNYVQFIEAPWNKESIETSPKLLKEISGALKMSGLQDVAKEVDRIENFTSIYMLEPDYKPTVDQLDLLAESVASLEYYLEYLSNGTKGEQSILNLARTNIESLFKSVEDHDAGKKDIQEIDADLDKMSDDDFDLELEMTDEVEYNEVSEEESYDQLLAEEADDQVNEEQVVTNAELTVDDEEVIVEKEELLVLFSDETDDDIKEVFLEEFEEELEHLNSIYPRWKKNPEEQLELLGEIRRIYHTLKGSGRLVGAQAIGDYSWRFEDITNMVLNKSKDINHSYLLIMERSMELLPGLLEALKNSSAVPVGYHELLAAADKVAKDETITEEELIPKIEQKSNEIEASEEGISETIEKDNINDQEEKSDSLESKLDNIELEPIEESIAEDQTNDDGSDLESDELEDTLDFDLEEDISEQDQSSGDLNDETESHDENELSLLPLDEDQGIDETEEIPELTLDIELDEDMSEDNGLTLEAMDEEKLIDQDEHDLTIELEDDKLNDDHHDEIDSNIEVEDKSFELEPIDKSNGIDDLELEIELENFEDDEMDLSLDTFEDFNLDSDAPVEEDEINVSDQTLSLVKDPELSSDRLIAHEKNDQSLTENNEDNTVEVNDEIEVEENHEPDEDLSVDPVFVEILQQEVEGHLQEVQEYVNSAKNNNNYQSTEKFIRVIHTLNGAANMASVDSIVAMTTPLELAAKLTNEMGENFTSENMDQILLFKQEASKIMKDLSARSKIYDKVKDLGGYFIGIYDNLEDKKQNLQNENDSISEFDLSQFIDNSSSSGDQQDKDDHIEESLADNSDDFDFDLNLNETVIEDALEQSQSESQHDEVESNVDEFIEDESSENELSIDDLDFSGTDVHESIEIEELQLDEESVVIEKSTESDDELDSYDNEESVFESDNTEEENIEQTILEDMESDLAEVEDQVEVDTIRQDNTTSNDVKPEAIIPTSYDENTLTTDQNTSEIDEELLEIFKEEADDILDRTEHVLSELEENPSDTTLIVALQRDLHTLKGGARMAGLENIGELSHVLESLLEIISEDNRSVNTQTLHAIHDVFDQLSKMKEEKDFGQSIDIAENVKQIKHLVGLDNASIPEESKLDQDFLAPVADEEIVEDDVSAEQENNLKKSNVLSGNQIKVNSELLDNLVNYAGEVSIYRSRLEQEVGSFRVNLSELGNTVARIREQLRKLDVETETQIMSTFQTSGENLDFDPLEMDRFSQLQQLSRSLAESVSDLTSIHSYLDDVARTSDNLLTQQSRVNTELQEGLMETRLVSFNSIVPRLRRLIRSTSKELDKPVRMEVHGAEGEMDKTVLEGVIAPLEHMLRNALAHGIEQDRSINNKPDEGNIIIDVRREATEVVITVSDDGGGINRKRVQEIAEKKGIIKPGMKLTEKNIDRLILKSGFSTVEEVTKLAGRGVGMDVVSNQINLLGGSLDISSEKDVGTKFHIRLPYTLALSSALLVEIAETIYAIPVSGLEGIIRMPHEDYKQNITEQDFVYEYANEEYLVQELDKLLDLESEIVIENGQVPLVMIRSGNQGVALRVDRILGSREIVVKTVGSQISSVPGIYGATVLGDGNVVLILDIIPLSRAYIKKLEGLEDGADLYVQEEIEKDPIVMIVDDSITMRKVGERILRRNNYDVVTAKDGLDALDNLKEVIPDVMLLDIEMPRMDGYELAIEMKKEEKYTNIPIIMITSRTGEKHRQRAIDLGVDRYLGKPYQEADLLENISELIEQSKG